MLSCTKIDDEPVAKKSTAPGAWRGAVRFSDNPITVRREQPEPELPVLQQPEQARRELQRPGLPERQEPRVRPELQELQRPGREQPEPGWFRRAPE